MPEQLGASITVPDTVVTMSLEDYNTPSPDVVDAVTAVSTPRWDGSQVVLHSFSGVEIDVKLIEEGPDGAPTISDITQRAADLTMIGVLVLLEAAMSDEKDTEEEKVTAAEVVVRPSDISGEAIVYMGNGSFQRGLLSLEQIGAAISAGASAVLEANAGKRELP